MLFFIFSFVISIASIFIVYYIPCFHAIVAAYMAPDKASLLKLYGCCGCFGCFDFFAAIIISRGGGVSNNTYLYE